MVISSPLRALAAGAFLFLSAPWSAADLPSPPAAGQSLASTVSKTRAMVQSGRFDETLAILRPLSAAHPGHLTMKFQIGLATIGASQRPGVSDDARDALLDEAITAFRAMLIAQPGLVRVRMELARAFFLKGEDQLATLHFEQVLAGKPPAPVVLNLNRFLNIMRARKRWSVRVGAALAPDSNIGAGSKEQTILIDTQFGWLPFTFDDDTTAKSGVGISAWADGEYQYPLGDRYRLRAGGDISRREYRSSEFDRMSGPGYAGPRSLVGKYTEASLLASARHDWTGRGSRIPPTTISASALKAGTGSAGGRR